MCVLLVFMALSGCCVLLSADGSLPHAGKHRSFSTNPPHSYSSLFGKHGCICAANSSIEQKNDTIAHCDCTGAGAVKL